MRETLKNIGSDSLQRFHAKKKQDWLFDDPAQITLLINMLSWVKSVESAFDNLKQNKNAFQTAFDNQV